MSIQLMIGYKQPAKIGVLELDASLNENHTFDSSVTSFPVENGSNISDNILNAPIRLDINGFVTNNPITTTGNQNDITRNEYGNRVDLALDELLKIREERKLIDIVTGLKVYSDMALEKLSIPRSAGIGDTLRFSSSFVQVKIVNSETVKIPNVKNDVEDKASDVADDGKVTTKDPTEEQKKTVSLLRKAENWVKKKVF